MAGAQQRRVAGDEPRLFEAAQPPPARRGRQADALGELLIGDAGIRLQLFEDAPVEAVERTAAMAQDRGTSHEQEYCQIPR